MLYYNTPAHLPWYMPIWQIEISFSDQAAWETIGLYQVALEHNLL